MSLRRFRGQLDVVDSVLVGAALVFAITAPLYVGGYWAHTLLVQVFWYGIAASSLIFLSAYAGMVSLAQVSLYGIAGYTLANLVTTAEVSKGLHLGWNPWAGIVLAIVVTTAIGLLLGAVASRSAGIYFLMITLAFGVLANTFFGQVTLLSGFSGIGQIDQYTPGVIDAPAHPNRLYYIALVASVLVYVMTRYLTRTPFGIALQGVRDDPVRMTSLGYNVPLHRTVLARYALGFAEAVHHLLQVFPVQFDPAPSHQSQPICLRQEFRISAAVSVSPSSVTSILKSSSASCPNPDGGLLPTVPVTRGRGGRFPRHTAGIRTTTPAASSSGTSLRSCSASSGDHRKGWKISPASTIAFSHGHASAARCTGRSSERRRSLLDAPAYSRNACPSGRCCALACAESRVV